MLSVHLLHNPRLSLQEHKEWGKMEKYSPKTLYCFPSRCFELQGLRDEATAPKYKARDGKK